MLQSLRACVFVSQELCQSHKPSVVVVTAAAAAVFMAVVDRQHW
jgi:hypothetical protein